MRKNILFLFIAASAWLCAHGNCQEANTNNLKIAIFGTGKTFGFPEYYNAENLAKILKQIKLETPDAVIFNGNLIQGLEQSTNAESLREFKTNLMAFTDTLKLHLGSKIPVYTIMGNHSFVNSEAVTIFKNYFEIKDPAPLEPYQLAYSFKIGNVKFTLLATGLYETKFRAYGAMARSMPILDWLEKTLRTGVDEMDALFVIGHEPAYSPGFSEGVYSGLDQIPETRDRFWNILKNNKVLAYICSHELMYDRSNHQGVWQLISGGLGDPERIAEEEKMFRHFLLLSIPANRQENPSIKAIDVNGKEWDKFQMIPIGEPVHHLRISKN